MKLPASRTLNGLGAMATVFLMATAYYMQYQMHLEPCPLCMLQRLLLLGVGLVLIAAFIHNPHQKGVQFYGLGTFTMASLGLAAALRHVWLQHLPEDQVPACGPGWDYLVDALPVADIVRTMIRGTGDCAKITWTLLSLSIPEWMLLVFGGFMGLGVIQILRRPH